MTILLSFSSLVQHLNGNVLKSSCIVLSGKFLFQQKYYLSIECRGDPFQTKGHSPYFSLICKNSTAGSLHKASQVNINIQRAADFRNRIIFYVILKGDFIFNFARNVIHILTRIHVEGTSIVIYQLFFVSFMIFLLQFATSHAFFTN